ncbi:hypothetical protein Bbelb_396930 [Branchiostoma belcheri]|nr:hypothetical protein Bbelb_396930 [Branchiostoma belcheri]
MTTQNTRAPYQVLRTCNARATHLISTVYKDDLTGDCQLVSKMPRKAQKKTTRQDPKKRAAEDTRAASDDEDHRTCTHLQRASTAGTRQRGNRTEIVRCKHVQLTYHLRNVRCTQPLTARRVVQTTGLFKAFPYLSLGHNPLYVLLRAFYVQNRGQTKHPCAHVQLTYHLRNVRCTQPLTARPHSYTLRNRASDVRVTPVQSCAPDVDIWRETYNLQAGPTESRQRLGQTGRAQGY